jgi:hypothetical protein
MLNNNVIYHVDRALLFWLNTDKNWLASSYLCYKFDCL